MNGKFFSSGFLIIFLAVFFSGCATLRDSGVPAPEMDTTETGIATGAVLGAGMGAVIGATAGQVGAGAVVGGIAGGATGGVIGKALETNEKRLDAHDQKLGMNTRPTGGASVRSRIWAPADDIEHGSNRPSGNRGIAAKYVAPAGTRASENLQSSKEVIRIAVDPSTLPGSSEVSAQKRSPAQVTQIQKDSSHMHARRAHQQSDSITSEDMRNAATPAHTYKNTGLPQARQVPGSAPRIELQKPRAELPPVRKPGFGQNSQTSSMVRASGEDTKIVQRTQQHARAMMAEPQKETTSKKTSSLSAVPAKKTVQEKNLSASCDKGRNEIARARSAASDSDKVFYLRRAIQVCPEDPSLRVELGKIYSRLGLKDDARKEFTKALDFDPSNESAQDELSIMMLDSHVN